ncbi:uncharacterized protein [Eurosta solidaginis]|uniref:uncharacterized protein n=1 Tax=Eurosta solidaginis TaxID=178769 RepID=UPI003530F3E3
MSPPASSSSIPPSLPSPDFLHLQSSMSPQETPELPSTLLSEQDENNCNWVDISGKVAEFLKNFERTNDVLSRVKDEAVPNLKALFVDVIDCLTNINKESGELLLFAKKENEKLSSTNFNLTIGNGVLIDHDPGRRNKISSSNERKYLSSLGRYQPKLDIYPTNTDIPTNKQRRFNPVWYEEFSFLEYSPHKDAAFCFACILFPEGPGRCNASSEWVSVGVRQWHKMKSHGQDKKGKLLQHFTSESHNAALSDYSNFINEGIHVDILIDRSIRDNKIKEVQEKEYHSKVLRVLFDVARTWSQRFTSKQ